MTAPVSSQQDSKTDNAALVHASLIQPAHHSCTEGAPRSGRPKLCCGRLKSTRSPITHSACLVLSERLLLVTVCVQSDLPELQFQLMVVFTGKSFVQSLMEILKPKAVIYLKHWQSESKIVHAIEQVHLRIQIWRLIGLL